MGDEYYLQSPACSVLHCSRACSAGHSLCLQHCRPGLLHAEQTLAEECDQLGHDPREPELDGVDEAAGDLGDLGVPDGQQGGAPPGPGQRLHDPAELAAAKLAHQLLPPALPLDDAPQAPAEHHVGAVSLLALSVQRLTNEKSVFRVLTNETRVLPGRTLSAPSPGRSQCSGRRS